MEVAFPTDIELTAASALLLLSSNNTTTTTISSSKLQDVPIFELEKKSSEKCDEIEMDNSTDDSTMTLCRSSLTTDDYCSVVVPSHRFKLKASAVARYRYMDLKVARRARSKVIYKGYSDKKSAPKVWAKPQAKNMKRVSSSKAVTDITTTTTTTTTEVSCLSSGGTSEISSARNREKGVVVEQKRRRGTGPSYISRRAEAILRLLLSKGRASEVSIRHVLGDSPDTSKALRMLLRMDEVKRSGAGGRVDPFIYTVAAENDSSISK